MGTERTELALAIPLFFLAACGELDGAPDSVGQKQSFSLCPKTSDARQRLYEQVKGFADHQNANLVDRGAGAQRELSEIGSAVLKNTGGEVILLTVEKADKFRISVTNLGLTEKVALSVRSWGRTGEPRAVAGLMNDLARYWSIQSVDGAVANDPPC